MKMIIYLLLISWLGLCVSSCKKEQKQTGKRDITEGSIRGKWNLIHVYGGIAGVNEQHPTGETTWDFGATHVQVNNLGSTSSYFYLPTGNYVYEVIEANGKSYLSINDSEIGSFVINELEMNINENEKHDAEGACGFFMELVR